MSRFCTLALVVALLSAQRDSRPPGHRRRGGWRGTPACGTPIYKVSPFLERRWNSVAIGSGIVPHIETITSQLPARSRQFSLTVAFWRVARRHWRVM